MSCHGPRPTTTTTTTGPPPAHPPTHRGVLLGRVHVQMRSGNPSEINQLRPITYWVACSLASGARFRQKPWLKGGFLGALVRKKFRAFLQSPLLESQKLYKGPVLFCPRASCPARYYPGAVGSKQAPLHGHYVAHSGPMCTAASYKNNWYCAAAFWLKANLWVPQHVHQYGAWQPGVLLPC